MYSISDAEYIKDFTMLLNDDIIDCFTEKTKITVEQEKEIEAVSKEAQEIRSTLIKSEELSKKKKSPKNPRPKNPE